MLSIRFTGTDSFGPVAVCACAAFACVAGSLARWCALAVVALAAYAMPAVAQVADFPPGEFNAVDSNRFAGSPGPDWRNILVGTGQGISNRPSLFGGLRESRRFGLFDNAAYRGLYIPLAPTWQAVIDTSRFPVQGVLTQYTFGAQLKKVLLGEWVAGVGFRINDYTRSAS